MRRDDGKTKTRFPDHKCDSDHSTGLWRALITNALNRSANISRITSLEDIKRGSAECDNQLDDEKFLFNSDDVRRNLCNSKARTPSWKRGSIEKAFGEVAIKKRLTERHQVIERGSIQMRLASDSTDQMKFSLLSTSNFTQRRRSAEPVLRSFTPLGWLISGH